MQTVTKRLNRVIGQLSGIVKMIESEQDCAKIIVQFQAAKAALDAAFSESLNLNLEKCLAKNDAQNMKNILKLITKK